MSLVEQLADFVVTASYEALSQAARKALKIRVLDSLGCAIGALSGEPIQYIREHINEFGGSERCTLIGGGKTAPDRAAFYNSALVRYLDFNDSYIAKGETCHPSDNLGAVLAASEYARCSGREFLTGLAVAYQVQCRLSDVAPVRARGFDHTTQGSYAAAAGISKVLGLNTGQTANAIAISGTAFNALRVTRTGALSHWKGLAYPNTAFCATHASFLAMRGITGPREVFEGNKGFMDSIAGRFTLDWSSENLERVNQTIIKKYNAEIHSQSSLEGILQLQEEHRLRPEDISHIEIVIFDVAYHIIGGGEEGDKAHVRTKEEADHSLPYMVAAALLDNEVTPAQYRPERIRGEDVQTLLRKISVKPLKEYSELFPERMPACLTVTMKDGKVFRIEKNNYEGFHTRPMSWEGVTDKFAGLSKPFTGDALCLEITDAVQDLENIPVSELTGLLAKVKVS